MTTPNREVFANNAADTLDGGIDDTQTTLDLNDASEMPSTGNFRLICETELMLCTARSGNTLTVVRGIEGSSAASHTDATGVAQVATEGNVQRWARDNVGLWNATSRPPFGIYDASGALITSSSFTATNLGSAVVTDDGQTIGINDPARASGENLRLLTLAAPGTPYSVIAAFSGAAIATSNTEPNFGLCFRNSTSAKVSGLAIDWRQLATVGQVAVFQWTNSTTFSSVALARVGLWYTGELIWQKITDDGTNTVYSISQDGVSWIQLFSEARGTFFSGGNTPNQVGFYANNAGGSSTTTNLLARVHSFSFA